MVRVDITGLLIIAFATVIGAIAGNTLIGLAIGLGIVLLAEIAGHAW